MNVKKKTIVQELEVEFTDNNTPVERMRHRDSDGDGVNDLIDSGYSKPQDSYAYREIRVDDYYRLKKAGFDVEHCCRRSSNPDSYILRCNDKQTAEVEAILKSVVKRTITH